MQTSAAPIGNRQIDCRIVEAKVWIVYEYIGGKIRSRCLWPHAGWHEPIEACSFCINYRP